MTDENSIDGKKFRLFILGAGFSKPAGMPLAQELWELIRSNASGVGGRAEKFDNDLSAYIDYVKRTSGKHLELDDVNFEEFCEFLDVQHYLGTRGSHTWSEAGNETTLIIKNQIGRILSQRMADGPDNWDLYLSFAEQLGPSDTVITFNYDTPLRRRMTASSP